MSCATSPRRSSSILGTLAALSAISGAVPGNPTLTTIIQCPQFRRPDGSFLVIESEPDGFQPCIYHPSVGLLMAFPNIGVDPTNALSIYISSNPDPLTPLNRAAALVQEELFGSGNPPFSVNTPLIKGEIGRDFINEGGTDPSILIPEPPTPPATAAPVHTDPAPRSASEERDHTQPKPFTTYHTSQDEIDRNLRGPHDSELTNASNCIKGMCAAMNSLKLCADTFYGLGHLAESGYVHRSIGELNFAIEQAMDREEELARIISNHSSENGND